MELFLSGARVSYVVDPLRSISTTQRHPESPEISKSLTSHSVFYTDIILVPKVQRIASLWSNYVVM
jgi:hypothetical protein